MSHESFCPRTLCQSKLGYGSHGTVVYEGSFPGRAVAVKRLIREHVDLVESEVSLLKDADDHPNIIRYFYREVDENFLYIALTLCPASLADILEQRDRFREIADSSIPSVPCARIRLVSALARYRAPRHQTWKHPHFKCKAGRIKWAPNADIRLWALSEA